MTKSIDPNLVPKRKLASGEMIPCIGMGTFGSDRFTPEQVSAAVGGAIRCGYRLFDCAAIYGNEDLIGKVFNQAINDGTVKREDLFITSKVWNDMQGKDISIDIGAFAPSKGNIIYFVSKGSKPKLAAY